MDSTVKHLTTEELEAALDHLRQAPKDDGVVELIVRRPQHNLPGKPFMSIRTPLRSR